MNILYIAYSCSPFCGSEDKIGWNISVESAKMNNVFVITKEEHRESIEQYLQENPMENIRFYYVDIPDFFKRIFRGSFYSGRLNIWHRNALKLARKICEQEKIQIIHQVTPIEFRSIGDYGKIPNTRYVCGPLGAGQAIPGCLMKYMGPKVLVEYIRLLANYCSLCILKLSGKIQRCDYLLFVNQETVDFLRPIIDGIPYELCFDNGIQECELEKSQDDHRGGENIARKCVFLVAGRLINIKGHDFLFDALQRIPPELEYECRVLGDGPNFGRYAERITSSGMDHRVILKGAIPFEQMSEEYQQADVLVFPSLRESSGAVLLEAMAKGLPVVTINKFGGATILDQNTAWLYEGRTKEEYIENLKDALVECIENPGEVECRGKNARERAEQFTWEERVKQYQKIYLGVVDE